MKKIVITQEVETKAEMVKLLVSIAQMIDQGYTKGPHWQLETIKDEENFVSPI